MAEEGFRTFAFLTMIKTIEYTRFKTIKLQFQGKARRGVVTAFEELLKFSQ